MTSNPNGKNMTGCHASGRLELLTQSVRLRNCLWNFFSASESSLGIDSLSTGSSLIFCKDVYITTRFEDWKTTHQLSIW